MDLPTVAIVGRPNVGKSSLFNTLVGRPISIVDAVAGVTRDRVLHEVRREDLRFDLVDTGGIGIVDSDQLEADVERQIERAITAADRLLFVVDGREGVTALDREIAERLRPHVDRVHLVVNKIDHHQLDDEALAFCELGLGDPVAVSAQQIRGLRDLLEALRPFIPAADDVAEAESLAASEGRIALCFAGRRNVGKSSLTNALCGEERVIVADQAGTTRDAIDVRLDHGEGRYLLIDTAGLRRKKQLHEDLEFYAACRTERAIRRADLVFLVLDAADEIGTVDKKLAHFCEASGKPTVLVVNKWDLAEAGGAQRQQYTAWLRDRLPGLRWAPLHFTCASDRRFVSELLPLAEELLVEYRQRIPTAELNRLLEAAVARRAPRKVGPSATRMYYATQADTAPPTVLVFVNRTDWIESGYSRYLENYLRERTGLGRVPLRILFKARSSRFHDNEDRHPVTRAKNRAEVKRRLIVPASKRKRR